MESPVAGLWGNVIQVFENIDGISLNAHLDAVASGKVSGSISYYVGSEKVKTPFVDLETREINIQETYLEHLWAYIYSVFVMYEAGVQIQLDSSEFDGSLMLDTPLLHRAKLLFDWSISLTYKHSKWDEGLPNPRNIEFEEEKVYIEKTNEIFKYSVAYLLFHEFSHLTQGHDSFFLGVNVRDLNELDVAELVQIENEADQFAFDKLISSQSDEDEAWVKGLSILFVVTSALLLSLAAGSPKQKIHPDLDQRVLNVINSLNLNTEESSFYLWYLCCFSTRLYLLERSIYVPSGSYDTAQDAFHSLLEIVNQEDRSRHPMNMSTIKRRINEDTQ